MRQETPLAEDQKTSSPPRGLREPSFVLVCAGQLFAYVSNMLIIPILPLYLVSLGRGESFVGVLMGVYNVTSFISRPIMGKLSDMGRLKEVLSGSGVAICFCTFLYIVPNTLVLFLGRMGHGLGWGALNVGGSVWVALEAPQERRAEALGYYTLAQKIGVTLSPPLGLFLYQRFNFPPIAILAAIIGLMVTVVSLPMRYSAQPVRRAPLEGRWYARLVERSAFLSTGIMTLAQINQPATSWLVPLYFVSQDIPHVELYFLVFGVGGVAARAVVSSWTDRIGRQRSIMLGLALQLAGVVTLGLSNGLLGMLGGSLFYTVGNAVSEPSLYAIAIDNAPADRQGAAMATYTMAFQLGGGIGAVSMGYTVERLGYKAMYVLATLAAFAALALSSRSGSRRAQAPVVGA